MYTLFFSPGSCSLVIHVLLRELEVPFELKRVDLQAGEHLAAPYLEVNPKGKVPALLTPDGTLTECVAIVEYLCDRHGDGSLLGKPGSWERARVLERIATLATEVHPLFNRFFHADDFSDEPAVREAVKARGTVKLAEWFRREDAALTQPFWSGSTLTAADFYFAVIVRWGRWLDPPATRLPNLEPFYTRITSRPSFAAALAAEGIGAFG